MKVLVIKADVALKPEVINRISLSLKRDFDNGKPITIGPGVTYEVVEADDIKFVANNSDA